MLHVQVTLNVITRVSNLGFPLSKTLDFKTTLIIKQQIETKGSKYFYSKIN